MTRLSRQFMQYGIPLAAVTFLLGFFLGGQDEHATVQDPSGEEARPAAAQPAAPSIGMVRIIREDQTGEEAETTDLPAELPVAEALDGPDDSVQVKMLVQRWTELESLVGRLDRRLADLEKDLSTWKSQQAATAADADERAADTLPIDTPDEQRVALMTVGVSETLAADIIQRQSELELERLELRDRAIREGWHRSDRYFEAARELNARDVDLRGEIGEQAYDQYLYQTGQSNRIKVSSVIQSSAADLSGLMPGDIIESYGDQRIYDFSDLRTSTTQGDSGEEVSVLVRRDGYMFETKVPRGPLGVRIEAENVSPEG